MTELEAFMMNSLYRSTCPDAVELGEYQMGLLAPDREQTIREHLRECRLCSGEAKALENFHKILASDIEIRPAERIQTLVARLISNMASGNALTPAFGLRGEADQVMAFEAGESQLSLSIDTDPENPHRRTLTGLLIGVPPEGIHVNLFHGQRMSTLGMVDELGNFTIAGVKPGQYELTLRGGTFEIYVSPLQID